MVKNAKDEQKEAMKAMMAVLKAMKAAKGAKGKKAQEAKLTKALEIAKKAMTALKAAGQAKKKSNTKWMRLMTPNKFVNIKIKDGQVPEMWMMKESYFYKAVRKSLDTIIFILDDKANDKYR